MNTSSVNNETVSKPAENTFEPLHVGFIVFYAKREETNSKLDIEEGGHQQEIVILTSQKIISVCEWLNDLSSFSSFNPQSSNVQENSCVLLCFHKTSIIAESPTYQSHPIFGPKPFRFIYFFEMRLLICDVTDTATHNLTAFHNIKSGRGVMPSSRPPAVRLLCRYRSLKCMRCNVAAFTTADLWTFRAKVLPSVDLFREEKRQFDGVPAHLKAKPGHLTTFSLHVCVKSSPAPPPK